MYKRTVGPFSCSSISLGCMNLSHGYGIPTDRAKAEKLLLDALEMGYNFFDTATLYGFGENESLIGDVLGSKRNQFTLASKCGLFRNAEGKREVNGRPEVLRQNCEDSLKRLKTDVIDLYYLHRWDKRVPIEESVGALADLVREGKIKTIGLSEVSAPTLHKAHKEHPIAALQTEYSLWTRNPEIAVLDACKQLGVSFVAFSPLGRGFLGGQLTDPSQLNDSDMRKGMPRFQPAAYRRNLALLSGLKALADGLDATPAQVALAWVLAQGNHIVAIPGTTNERHLQDNYNAKRLSLTVDQIAELDYLFTPERVVGGRYAPASQAEVDTEEFND